MIRLYHSVLCPFAHRSRALLIRLGIDFEEVEIDLDDRDPEFLKLTPTGRVPLLVDGDLLLYESRIINEYLAESRRWAGSLPADPALRARHRLAMKQWDGVVSAAFYRSIVDRDRYAGMRPELERELDALQDTLGATGDAVDNLLGYHLAPFWLRIDWLRELSALPAVVDARPALRAWLDRAAALEPIRRTAPGRDAVIHLWQDRIGS